MMLRNKVPLKRKRKHSRQISRIDNFILKTTPIPKYKSELPPQLKATWLPHQIGRVEFDNDQPNCVAGDYQNIYILEKFFFARVQLINEYRLYFAKKKCAPFNIKIYMQAFPIV